MKTLLAAFLLLPSVSFCSSLLTQTARDVLSQSHDRAKAEVFLEQAILENGDDPEPYELLAALKSGDLKNNPDELRSVVGPLVTRLLALREQNTATKSSDLALALELDARFLNQVGQDAEAKPLLARSLVIRQRSVHEAHAQKTGQAILSASFRVGDGVLPPSVLTKEDPGYSEDARMSKVSGTVLLNIVVDPEGSPTQVELVRSLGFGLDEKAADAVGAWRFKPGMKNGLPVPVRATIEVNFRLL